MKVKYKGIIFDLDGTLADTLLDIGAATNRALAARGFGEHAPESYVSRVGWGIKQVAFLSLPQDAQNEETAALVAEDSVRFYAESPLAHTRPYPGILELLGELRRRKVKMVVLTNKPDPIAQMVVAGLFPNGTFESVRGEVFGKPRKPDPACVWEMLIDLELTPADVIFVGDSEVDVQTAVASGCFPMGVSWGYRPLDVIEKAGARRIIDKPHELLEFF
ncbi:MAG: HAD family hydrolase [Treponema sp.]|jgi:phosphoglycolate phosphatase|nr:HAD family hydrolase [Treponema sp.]